MKVNEIMSSNPACCTPKSNMTEVAQLMDNNDCGEIPVVDDLESRKLQGVITDRDIVVRAVAKGSGPSETVVGDIMTSTLVTVKPDDDVQECRQKMEQHQVRRLPVVDEQGRVSGMVAQADIARMTGPSETAEVVQEVSQPRH